RAPPAIYPLSLHDALPIFPARRALEPPRRGPLPRPTSTPSHRAIPLLGSDRPPRLEAAARTRRRRRGRPPSAPSHRAATHLRPRSEEHTSELQSRENLVCR